MLVLVVVVVVVVGPSGSSSSTSNSSSSSSSSSVANLRPIFPAASLLLLLREAPSNQRAPRWQRARFLPTIRAPDYKSSEAPANSQMGFDTHAYHVY